MCLESPTTSVRFKWLQLKSNLQQLNSKTNTLAKIGQLMMMKLKFFEFQIFSFIHIVVKFCGKKGYFYFFDVSKKVFIYYLVLRYFLLMSSLYKHDTAHPIYII